MYRTNRIKALDEDDHLRCYCYKKNLDLDHRFYILFEVTSMSRSGVLPLTKIQLSAAFVSSCTVALLRKHKDYDTLPSSHWTGVYLLPILVVRHDMFMATG